MYHFSRIWKYYELPWRGKSESIVFHLAPSRLFGLCMEQEDIPKIRWSINLYWEREREGEYTLEKTTQAVLVSYDGQYLISMISVPHSRPSILEEEEEEEKGGCQAHKYSKQSSLDEEQKSEFSISRVRLLRRRCFSLSLLLSRNRTRTQSSKNRVSTWAYTHGGLYVLARVAGEVLELEGRWQQGVLRRSDMIQLREEGSGDRALSLSG